MSAFDEQAVMEDRDSILREMGNQADYYEEKIAALRARVERLEGALGKSTEILQEIFDGGDLPNHAYSLTVRRIDSRIHVNRAVLEAK